MSNKISLRLFIAVISLLMSSATSLSLAPIDDLVTDSQPIPTEQNNKRFWCNCLCRKHPKKEVCGVDNITYPSACHARCAGVRIASQGSCIDCTLVRCSTQYVPVCGTDGLTHKNYCIMICIDQVAFQHNGECRRGLPCPCPPGAPWVCAVNGQFYQGSCMATCYLKFFLDPLETCGVPPPEQFPLH